LTTEGENGSSSSSHSRLTIEPSTTSWTKAQTTSIARFNLTSDTIVDVLTAFNGAPRSGKGKVPVRVELDLQGMLPMEQSEEPVPQRLVGSVSLNSRTDEWGAILPSGAQQLTDLLALNSNDQLFGIGDGRTALTLAMTSVPRQAITVTDNLDAHATLVHVLKAVAERRPLHWSAVGTDKAATLGPAKIRATWLTPATILASSEGQESTVALLFGSKLQGDAHLGLARSLANLLAPGAAIVTSQQWPHCHAGLVGPVVRTRLPFERLPGGGSVYVYLVAPRLGIIASHFRQSHWVTSEDASELQALVTPPSLRNATKGVVMSVSEGEQWLMQYASDAEHLHRRVLSLVAGLGAGKIQWTFLRQWALGRFLGRMDSPIRCVFADLVARVAGVEQAAIRLSDAETSQLGGQRTTYSELHPASLKSILSAVAIQNGEVLFDLGSGLGKILFQAALTKSVQARGIELSPTRQSRAKAMWALLQKPEQRRELGGLDASGPAAPGGTVEILEGDFALLHASLWKDVSVALLHVLAYPGTQEAQFTMATTLAREAMPGTTLVSVTELRGCHRGLQLVQKLMVKVDWSETTVPAFVYLVAPRPAGGLMQEAPPYSPVAGREFRSLHRSSLATDIGSSLEDRLTAEVSVPVSTPRMSHWVLLTNSTKHAPFQLAWFRGGSSTAWDCMFADMEYIIAMHVGKQGTVQSYWQDSTSANKNRGLDNLKWSSLGGPRTYGEVLSSSAASLLASLNLGAEDVFYDLGSGAGKVVLQAHLQTNVRRAAGIELEEQRHLAAKGVFEEARRAGVVDEAREVEFILGDITNTSLWADATVLFMLCTCFPEEVLFKVATTVARSAVGTRLVVASFPLSQTGPVDVNGRSRELRLRHHAILPTTFSGGEPFFVYQVAFADDASAPADAAAVAAAQAAMERQER